jgi:hypothetical protein
MPVFLNDDWSMLRLIFARLHSKIHGHAQSEILFANVI